jgi:putative transposase
VTLKDIEAARVAYRRRLRTQIRERAACVADFLPAAESAPAPSLGPSAKRPKLRAYLEGD